MADFQTEIARNFTTVVVVISCESREKLPEYVQDEFHDTPNFAKLLQTCEWEDVTLDKTQGII
jgi:hypothetical protein